MKCPECGKRDDKVVDSRAHEEQELSYIRRRRECLDCAHRFTTYETTEMPRVFSLERVKAQVLIEQAVEALQAVNKII